MITENSTPRTQAKAFSMFSFAGNIGIFLGPLIGEFSQLYCLYVHWSLHGQVVPYLNQRSNILPSLGEFIYSRNTLIFYPRWSQDPLVLVPQYCLPCS
jgi:hypothetical protein